MHLSRRQFEIIQEQAIRELPYECCGLLAGIRKPDKKGGFENIVYEVAPCVNVLYSGREHGFEISFSEFIEVEREAAGLGYTILGSYHSHIDTAAVPSNSDIDFARPGDTMVIISVRHRRPAGVTAWYRRDDRGFHQEAIRVVE